MYKVKIGIVEDDVFYSTLLQHELASMDYKVLEPCTTYHEAITMLNSDAPDLVLLDVNLTGEKGGIDVANYIRKHLNIPFIFLTGGGSKEMLDQVKQVKPSAFLVKPFKQIDLHAAIEIAMSNFQSADRSHVIVNEEPKTISDTIFIKEGEYFYKVKYDDIFFLQSENVYVVVHSNQKKFMVRATLNDYLKKFDPAKFVRVHQRYAVNINKIEKINSEELLINNQEIPISASYKADLMKKLNLE